MQMNIINHCSWNCSYWNHRSWMSISSVEQIACSPIGSRKTECTTTRLHNCGDVGYWLYRIQQRRFPASRSHASSIDTTQASVWTDKNCASSLVVEVSCMANLNTSWFCNRHFRVRKILKYNEGAKYMESESAIDMQVSGIWNTTEQMHSDWIIWYFASLHYENYIVAEIKIVWKSQFVLLKHKSIIMSFSNWHVFWLHVL